jgi:hypothetical protein
MYLYWELRGDSVSGLKGKIDIVDFGAVIPKILQHPYDVGSGFPVGRNVMISH